MTLADHCLNVTDVEITRPTRTGPAGDQAGTATTVYSGLEGYYEPASSFVRIETGSEVRLRGLLMLDPLDEDGELLDVLVGDFVKYTDHAGRPTKKREVLRVEPAWKDGPELDHLEIGF